MNTYMKWILFTLLIVYVVSPMDFVPGPIDDILAIFLLLAANKKSPAIEKRDNEHIEVIDVDGREI
ncbi:MAG: hypothetical protein IJJ64_03725 [Butyrivibrio sp.]|nr:hypothetical protein [Butyrivibrio sp.]